MEHIQHIYEVEELEKEGIISIGDALLKEMNQDIKVAGIIRSKRVIHTKKGDPMAFVKIFDESEEMEIIIFPDLYKDVLYITEKNKIIVVTGHFEKNKEDVTFVSKEISLLEE